MKEVAYVVYLHSGGRWNLDQTFPESHAKEARKAAVDGVARKDAQGATLVRETDDREAGKTHELAVFSELKSAEIAPLAIAKGRDPVLDPKAAPEPLPYAAAAPAAAPAPAAKKSAARKRRGTRPVQVVLRIAGTLALSWAVAAVASWILGAVGGYTVFEFFLGARGQPVKVFGILFVVSFAVVLPNMVGWQDLTAVFTYGADGDARPPGGPRPAP
ncbi:MAG: hypothetical protein O2905_00190 [Proteobacteria bacterium]|nr:hypothetical protein [Pseudomonadota bacterium]